MKLFLVNRNEITFHKFYYESLYDDLKKRFFFNECYKVSIASKCNLPMQVGFITTNDHHWGKGKQISQTFFYAHFEF